MSDTNWQPPQPGDPGTPRDVNREEDVVWDGNQPDKYSGQPAKKAAAKKATPAEKTKE
jgi:hypothetical protein